MTTSIVTLKTIVAYLGASHPLAVYRFGKFVCLICGDGDTIHVHQVRPA